ncbi:ABC-type transport system permease protein (probable substrate thiamine) [Haladaptatus paucihalophilus DX253]|uniref:ABC-type transport system permease protein (Probable substrate thiamine) n=1 Tax=Haladaptatus paucihalophilus DX253 TaxID=797209 RepID=E7QMS1_HALPU|nr:MULTISPECIES: iron ABC transporter permease [Haladaptatus]EFW93716.1 ABC-type transport system permease protein (probable substrate thiamine) [Haladaptatus paucihalophilus DX253]GKZ15048.1 sulfate ABC transporter permease [Haladaptatus sp. T7]SHL48787.1 thiamine transport system permease protein [Haladaptatus paucihalophilus DX253]
MNPGRWLERHTLSLLGIVTSAVLVVLFYYPVAIVFADAGGLDAFLDVLTDRFYLFDIFGFTAYQALLSTLASVALGLPGAYILARYEFPGRRTIRSLTILPFVMPSILVAIGFVAMFGQNGLFNDVVGVIGLGPYSLLYNLPAIVAAHAFYNAPLVARVTNAAWESVDAREVETARSLGAGRFRAFRDVLVPQLLPAILTGALLTFIFTFMSFPIVLALGGFQYQTVEVWVYALVQRLDYSEAAVLAVLETTLSLALTYGYLRYEARQSAVSRASRPLPRKRLFSGDGGLAETLERAGVAVYLFVVLVLFLGPLVSTVLESFTGPSGFTLRYYEFLVTRQVSGASFQTKPGVAVQNSLLFGVGTLLVALPMGVVIAVLTRARKSRIVEAVAMAPLAVSGVMVGLGMLRGLVFGIPIAGTRIRVGGAVAIVAAHAVAAYPFVTRNVSPMLAGIDRRTVESARALGATRVRTLVDIELPLVAVGLAAGAAFAFAISIGEFDSTVILATGSSSYTMPVAVERFLGKQTLGPATAMGTVLLVVTAVSFVIIDRLGGRWEGG